jgi:hypothetical protein
MHPGHSDSRGEDDWENPLHRDIAMLGYLLGPVCRLQYEMDS